jgi:hypothetical protein
MASVIRPRCGPLWVLLAGGASVMAMSGCLWKSDVNELPRVVIDGPDAVHAGEPASFTARFTNMEPGQPSFEWGRESTCPKDLAAAQQSTSARKFEQTISWPIPAETTESERASFCLFVIATDSQGARVFQKHPVTLVDRKLLLTAPAQVTNNQPARYTARFSDDAAAAGKARFFWASSARGMPPSEPCDEALRGAQENQGARLVKTAEWESTAARKPYCVVAIAEDEFGAAYVGQQLITSIVNGGPPSSPRVVTPKESPVGIFSHVRVAAAADGELGPSDKLDFVWAVKRPDGTLLPAEGCEGAAPANSEICFDVPGAGNYQVEVDTTEAGVTARGRLSVPVEDRPPCIRMTDPLVLDDTGVTTVFSLDGEEKVLKVGQVMDDGDPLPSVGRASEGTFVWTIRTVSPGSAQQPAFSLLPYAIFNSFTLPAGQYRLGDQVEVRVEYRDRVDVHDLKARDLSHCGPGDLACETRPGSRCFLRVGWKVLYL